MTQPDNQRIVTYDVLGAQTARIDELTADTGWVTDQASAPTIVHRKIDNRVTVLAYGTYTSPSAANTTIASGLIADAPAQHDAPGAANLNGYSGILTVNTSGDVVVSNFTGASRANINAKVEYYTD